ncbi:MAG: 3-deoxy-D-manno-octulosonic acid transferase [Cyclobacteriaceae bacterium]|nr:3-deoxy-D-manno-octulosonic acid transferase [Cyclobacteriaceae bacterium]
MKLFLYNSFIWFYNLISHLIAPFHNKANYFVLGRKNLLRKVENEILKNIPIIWFHCASLGEFEQGRPIIESIKKRYPNYKILLTFFSPSGYELCKNYAYADYIYYLPIDTKSNARKWLDIINPKAVFFIKYEFWHNFINEIHQRNIPLFSVSSIFRKNQIFFKSYGDFNRDILSRFTHFFVQDKESQLLLEGIDIKKTTITGDTRFDRVNTIRQQTNTFAVVDAFKNGEKVFVIGSCWPEDMEVLAAFINQNEENIKFIIAPHEIYEMAVKRIENQIDKKTIRFSEATIENAKNSNVLIIDNMGMLSSLYQYGEYAYVGGAFGKGLHNILEAATFGLPVFFGNKNYSKFKEARDLIQLGGAYCVSDYHDLTQKFTNMNLNIASTTAESYVQNNTGATKKILDYCEKYIQ